MAPPIKPDLRMTAADRASTGLVPASATRRVFIRDLVGDCALGIHSHEKLGRQRVRVNLDLEVADDGPLTHDEIAAVVCYEEMAVGIRAILGGPHVNLAETLAESIAAFALNDPRVRVAHVRIEKLDVFEDCQSVGIAISRQRA